MIGSFGSIAFNVSAEQVRTFNGLSRKAEARFAEHELTGKKPKLEFIGPGLDQFSLSIRLDVALGLNPRTEINRINEIRDAGEALPLVFGGNYEGLFVIMSSSEDRRFHDNKGNILVADVTLDLKEYADG